MAVPMGEFTTAPRVDDVPYLTLVTSDQWQDVEETQATIEELLEEILGYDPELIRTGKSTSPRVDATQSYREMMQRILGYILEETAGLTPEVRAALDEIAAGDTTIARSVAEFESQFDSQSQADD